MSSRILAFGKSKIHFTSAEEHQTQWEQAVDGWYGFQIAELSRNNREFGEDWYASWERGVVLNYSPRLLTHKKDRFPALSETAQHFSRLLKDDYIAGLLWACVHETPHNLDALLGQLSDFSEYVAPSWSWASRDGYIEFGSPGPIVYNCTREYRDAEADIVLNSIDKFGQIKEVSLRITTKICTLPADMHNIEEGDLKWKRFRIEESEAPFAHCDLDWQPRLPTEPRRELMVLLLGSAVDTDSASDDSENSQSSLPETDGEASTESLENIRWAYGLLIYPVAGTDKFFRVGQFHSKSSDG
ncbi:hypothetical protein F5Y06DRAFT_308502 [Hypoxylon sp. FL0890]|nr:hypothetical protein F5Y06DRAFT_308502 [Hypoxylon sp. FL0890]